MVLYGYLDNMEFSAFLPIYQIKKKKYYQSEAKVSFQFLILISV